MKQVLSLLVFLLLVQDSFAQKIRFTDSGNAWMETSSSSDGTSYKNYNLGTDTVIGATQYKNIKFPQAWKYNYLAVRSDTIGKVYFFIDSVEVLVYDFSLQVGDTFRIAYKSDTFEHYVSDIDSTIMKLDTYRVFTMTFIRSTHPSRIGMSYKVIEGIGCVEGFLFPYFPQHGLATSKLRCFTTSGIAHEINPAVEHFDNKLSCKVSVHDINEEVNSITISPHPANANSIISLPYMVVSGEVMVYNSLGQIVKKQKINNKTQLVVGYLPCPGMYYYHVTDNEQEKLWQGKLVYQ